MMTADDAIAIGREVLAERQKTIPVVALNDLILEIRKEASRASEICAPHAPYNWCIGAIERHIRGFISDGQLKTMLACQQEYEALEFERNELESENEILTERAAKADDLAIEWKRKYNDRVDSSQSDHMYFCEFRDDLAKALGIQTGRESWWDIGDKKKNERLLKKVEEFKSALNPKICPAKKSTKPRWQVQKRMDFIRKTLDEKGRFNRDDLVKEFGISAQQASVDICSAARENPNLMRYNSSKKCYLPCVVRMED